MENGGNVGVRLRAEDLVIDVDPRNFTDGDDPFKRLCEDCGLCLNNYPTVITGSGGVHVYMNKPVDVSVLGSLPDYIGVEFKTLGQQVVSAGSIHPSTKKTYEWDFLTEDLINVPFASDRLLALIRRPQRSASQSDEGGQYDQEQLLNMLDALDPEDYREHGDWLELMMACHHATNGDARAEFVDWSTRDPSYMDDGVIIGRRWDSLHIKDDDGPMITYRTLNKALIDVGHEDLIPRVAAEEDFELVGEDDVPSHVLAETPEHERKNKLERMNETFWAVMEGGQFRVMWQQDEVLPGGQPRKKWVRAKVQDFKQMLSNQRVEVGGGDGESKVKQIADLWLDWGGRRSANDVVFDPERDHKGALNLWTGWGVEPRKNKGGGSWARLNELLLEVLCDHNEVVHKYALDWAAHMVQHPASPAGVAVCFQGGKGVGKGTWGRALVTIAGRHGLHVTSPDSLTGRFNDHLRDKILLFADEAVSPHDRGSESRLKGLITEPMLAYEGKGRDIVQGANMLHVVMASNDDWFVPADFEERRFMVQKTNKKWLGKHAKFQALHNELENGGYEALLFDLIARDLGDWAPRKDIPVTMAFANQKLYNMGPIGQWWFNVLTEGALPCEETVPGGLGWEQDGVKVFKQDFRESYNIHCRTNGIKHPGGMGRGLDKMFAGDLNKLVPNLGSQTKALVPDDRPDIKAHGDGRAWCYAFPDLKACRIAMDENLGIPVDWGIISDFLD
jgi:hypothetical protein